MTHAIQGIVVPNYIHNDNLDNYGLPHVLKTINLSTCFHPIWPLSKLDNNPFPMHCLIPSLIL